MYLAGPRFTTRKAGEPLTRRGCAPRGLHWVQTERLRLCRSLLGETPPCPEVTRTGPWLDDHLRRGPTPASIPDAPRSLRPEHSQPGGCASVKRGTLSGSHSHTV